MAWPGANGICKTKDNSKGLGWTVVCHLSCLFGEGMNRGWEKEEAREAGRQKEGRQILL